MQRRTLLVVVLFGALLLTGVTIVAAQEETPRFRGEPHLQVFAPDPELTPGTADELELQIANEGRIHSGNPGDRRALVTTARDVKVEADEGDAPIEIRTGRQSIGTLTEEEPRSVPLHVEIPEDAEPGTYDIEVEVRYRYVAFVSGVMQDDRRTTKTRTVEIEIDDGPRFDLRTVDSDIQVGESGSLTAEVENVGGQAARDLDVMLESTSPGVFFGESGVQSDTARLDRLDPGETATVEYDVDVRPGTTARNYSFDGSVAYTDPTGLRDVDERAALSAGAGSGAEQRFRVTDVDSTLRVGEEGDLHGTVTNEGPKPARNVVVQFTHESPNVIPIESDVAVGTLEPGESGEFSLPIEIGREAEPIDRNFDIAVAYRNQDNELRQYEDVDAPVTIAERRDEFLLSIENRTIETGETKLVDVEVTNNLDNEVTDVEAKLFADDPLDSDDDEGYVESLDPGESTTMTFELSAESGAVEKTYPISMDFRYDDHKGKSKISDTYRVAIDVTASTDEGLPWLLIGAIVLVFAVVVVGYAITRRRDDVFSVDDR